MKNKTNPLFLGVFLLVLGIIFGGLLAGVNALTAPVIEANRQKELEKQLEAVNVKSPSVIELDSYVNNVTAVYTGKVDGEDVIVVNTTNANKFTTISVLVVVKDNKVLNAVISAEATLTTHGMDNEVGAIKVIDATSSDDITGVSGATFSSGSIKACVQSALDQASLIGGDK